jgi:hypothetical protein
MGEVVSSVPVPVVGQLFDEVGDLPVELVEDLLVGGVGVLDDVVEYPGADDLLVVRDVLEDTVDLYDVGEEVGSPLG